MCCGHIPRDLFTFLVRGEAYVETTGNEQEHENQHAKDDGAYRQKDPGTPRALLGCWTKELFV